MKNYLSMRRKYDQKENDYISIENMTTNELATIIRGLNALKKHYEDTELVALPHFAEEKKRIEAMLEILEYPEVKE